MQIHFEELTLKLALLEFVFIWHFFCSTMVGANNWNCSQNRIFQYAKSFSKKLSKEEMPSKHNKSLSSSNNVFLTAPTEIGQFLLDACTSNSVCSSFKDEDFTATAVVYVGSCVLRSWLLDYSLYIVWVFLTLAYWFSWNWFLFTPSPV